MYSNFVLHYIVEYHEQGETPQQISISAGAVDYTAVGLAAYTEYAFRIQAVSESGNGNWTSEVAVRTHEGGKLNQSLFDHFPIASCTSV